MTRTYLISLFESSISSPCLIIDAQEILKLMAVTLKKKVVSHVLGMGDIENFVHGYCEARIP